MLWVAAAAAHCRSDSALRRAHQSPPPRYSPGKNTGGCYFLQCMEVKKESEVTRIYAITDLKRALCGIRKKLINLLEGFEFMDGNQAWRPGRMITQGAETHIASMSLLWNHSIFTGSTYSWLLLSPWNWVNKFTDLQQHPTTSKNFV